MFLRARTMSFNRMEQIAVKFRREEGAAGTVVDTRSLSHAIAAHKLWLQKRPDGVRINWSGLTLNDVSLPEAELTGAVLHGATLIDANLAGAKLAHALLEEADLERAVLTGADFSAAELLQANLDYAG